MLFLTPAAFDKTLAEAAGGDYAHWKSNLAGAKFSAQPLKGSIEIKAAENSAQEGKASNVVAMLRGRDPALQNEWVVLTAHFDHLGLREVPPGQDGIFNGADDNASGTAAVLEIARRLASAKPPERNVLAVLTSGEEMGLLGSAYYSIHPIVPNDRVVVNINVDMVGRSAGTVYSIAAGCDEMQTKAAEIGKQLGISVLPDPFPSWRLIYFVDSYHFARLNIPYIQFITEFHRDYHQPTDEPDRIRYEDLARIVEVIYGLADFYAQGGPKPVFKRPTWFLTAN
jgi:Zn-dependent M28 family amino/carboxypeptidase